MGDVTLGKEASVWYNTVIRADMAPISIGDQTNIQDLSLLHVDVGLPCVVGSRVGVGHRVVLHGCTVGDDCLIGMGSVLLNGVKLGAGSVVGAGALLTEGMEVPADSVVMGLPAKVIRKVDADLRARTQDTIRHYLDLVRHHRSGKVTKHPNSVITGL
ncbi:MAG: gamma carbonic anhydrase family protein [Myxococcota bacterium]|nr:gamma carbonic anhydrase family protein [Myxococcota bacterium]